MDTLEALRKLLGQRRNYWNARGRKFTSNTSRHRPYTHKARSSRTTRSKRKTRRKAASASRKRHRR